MSLKPTRLSHYWPIVIATCVASSVLLLIAHFAARNMTGSLQFLPLAPWIRGAVAISLCTTLFSLIGSDRNCHERRSLFILVAGLLTALCVSILLAGPEGMLGSLHAARLMLTSSEIFGLAPVLLACTIAHNRLALEHLRENATVPTIWTVLLATPPLLPLLTLIAPGIERDLAGLMLALTTVLGCLALLLQLYRKPASAAFTQAATLAGLTCIYFFPVQRGIATSGEAAAFLLIWTIAFAIYRYRLGSFTILANGSLYRSAGITVLGLIAGVLLHHSFGLLWLIDRGFSPIYVPIVGGILCLVWLSISYPSFDFRRNTTAVELFSLVTPLFFAPLLSIVASLHPTANESTFRNSAQHSVTPAETLPDNKWIELKAEGFAPRRRAHSGAVFDPLRGELLMTGSDTHGWDWDMSLYRFEVASRKWHRYGKAEPRYTYRNFNGVRVAGTITPTPWAMHVYDQLVLDSENDKLWLVSAPLHNHVPVPGGIRDVPWIFDLSTSTWAPQKSEESNPPVFFSAVSVLDPARHTIMATAASEAGILSIGIGKEFGLKRGGLWELGPDRRQWLPVSDTSPHGNNVSGVFDESVGALLIFERQLDFRVHAFLPGIQPGMAGQWTTHSIPDGPCVPINAYPATPSVYVSHLRKTLLITTGSNGKSRTCLYDAQTNSMTDLEIELPPKLDMNFTIAEDRRNKSVVLVTGDPYGNSPAQVWILKLELPQEQSQLRMNTHHSES